MTAIVTKLAIAVLGVALNASVALGGNVLWTDSIQTGAWPWGFSYSTCEHPINTTVVCSDANGSNLSVVPDPAGGTGKALRHYIDMANGGGRSEAAAITSRIPAFANQMNTRGEVWIEWEVFIPEAPTATGEGPWLSVMDFHSVGPSSRWHTDPGLFFCSTSWPCGFPADAGKLSTWNSMTSAGAGPSPAVPVNRWFKLQVHWVWSASPVPITFYLDGVQVLQIVTATKDTSLVNDTVEWYSKWYGSYYADSSWTPNPMVRYTRNVKISDAFIGSDPPPPPPPPTIFIGSRVKTTAAVNVRQRVQGKIRCTQPAGVLGTVVDGPRSGGGYTWWNVNFDSSCDGWVISTYIDNASSH